MQAFDLNVKRVSTHTQMQFSPDGRYLALPALGRSLRLSLIDTTAGGPAAVTVLEDAKWEFTFVPGRQELVHMVLGGDADLAAYDLETRTERAGGKLGHIYCLAAAPGGSTIYAGVLARADNQFAVHDLDPVTLTPRGRVFPSKEVVNRLALSPDGRVLVMEGYGQLGVFVLRGNWPPARARCRIVSKPVPNAFALSPDGSRLAAAQEAPAGFVVWDTKTGDEVVRSGKHRRHVTALACDPTRPLTASGDTGGRVFFWDAAGNVLRRFEWGLGKVAGLRFAPDGLRCAAVDVAGKVVIWDVDM